MARVKVSYKKQPDDLDNRYTINDIMSIMQVCRATVYNYFKYSNLEHFRDGKRVYVYKDAFNSWLKENNIEID